MSSRRQLVWTPALQGDQAIEPGFTESRLEAIAISLAPDDREFMGRVYVELGALGYGDAITRSRLDRRDDAIRLAADRLLPPESSTNEKAVTLARRLDAYLSTRWARLDHGLAAPRADADQSSRMMFWIARFNDGQSIGARQLTSILTGHRGR